MGTSWSIKDVAGGLIFVAVGLWFGLTGLGLEIGSARRMGPGYFPLVLSVILVLLGAAIALRGLRVAGTPLGVVPWRGLILIVAAPIMFGFALRGIGLAPATAGVVLLSAAGSVLSRIWTSVALAIGLTVFCAMVFLKGLGLPIPLIGPWLVPHTVVQQVTPAAVPADPAPAAAPATGG